MFGYFNAYIVPIDYSLSHAHVRTLAPHTRASMHAHTHAHARTKLCIHAHLCTRVCSKTYSRPTVQVGKRHLVVHFDGLCTRVWTITRQNTSICHFMTDPWEVIVFEKRVCQKRARTPWTARLCLWPCTENIHEICAVHIIFLRTLCGRLMVTELYTCNWFVKICGQWQICSKCRSDKHWPGEVAPPYGVFNVKTTAAMHSGDAS